MGKPRGRVSGSARVNKLSHPALCKLATPPRTFSKCWVGCIAWLGEVVLPRVILLGLLIIASLQMLRIAVQLALWPFGLPTWLKAFLELLGDALALRPRITHPTP